MRSVFSFSFFYVCLKKTLIVFRGNANRLKATCVFVRYAVSPRRSPPQPFVLGAAEPRQQPVVSFVRARLDPSAEFSWSSPDATTACQHDSWCVNTERCVGGENN